MILFDALDGDKESANNESLCPECLVVENVSLLLETKYLMLEFLYSSLEQWTCDDADGGASEEAARKIMVP